MDKIKDVNESETFVADPNAEITLKNQTENEKLEKEIEKNKKQRAEIKKQILNGKCPIRYFEKDGKIDWNNTIVREFFSSASDALKSLTATTDPELAFEIIGRGMEAIPENNIVKKANIATQSLADSAPRNATEARLCMQETVLYAQGMQYLIRAESENMIPQCEHYMKNAIKLLRLHNETVEALAKYRRGGEQKVVVQHVQVNGGKAIVGGGNVVAGTGGGG